MRDMYTIIDMASLSFLCTRWRAVPYGPISVGLFDERMFFWNCLVSLFLSPPACHVTVLFCVGLGDDLRVDLDLDFKTACFGGEEKVRHGSGVSHVRTHLTTLRGVVLLCAGTKPSFVLTTLASTLRSSSMAVPFVITFPFPFRCDFSYLNV